MSQPTPPLLTPPNDCCRRENIRRRAFARGRDVRVVFGGVFISLAALSLTACASFWLSGGLALLKISPSAFAPRTIEQRATITRNGEQKTLEMVFDIRADTMTVIGMALGARLFSFDYDGKEIVETKPLPNGLSAARIMNDLLLIYAPLDTLRAALPSGWTVSEEKGARQVFLDGALNISIRYFDGSSWQGRTVLDNHALHYQLTLDSHDVKNEAKDDEP
ncbi:MAG: DUF3261 domain-containing protein [Burkholderiales bacterium]|jgi:hypothetical protein|nr:DUF3261 domain-containing protein [Burkholderiales bacterium]